MKMEHTQCSEMLAFKLQTPGTSLTIPSEQSTSMTARHTHQNCVRVAPPEDEQVMPNTCRGFEFK
jgi:hypothetical protein